MTSARPTVVSSTVSVPHAVASGAVRRSNVVKEVERLKENREKRRQRQAELKEEKVIVCEKLNLFDCHYVH